LNTEYYSHFILFALLPDGLLSRAGHVNMTLRSSIRFGGKLNINDHHQRKNGLRGIVKFVCVISEATRYILFRLLAPRPSNLTNPYSSPHSPALLVPATGLLEKPTSPSVQWTNTTLYRRASIVE